MISERAIKVAEEIVEDLNGAGYYKDPAVLATFLARRFEAAGETGKTQAVAQAIAEDLNGAAYYMDPRILASFLDGQGLD